MAPPKSRHTPSLRILSGTLYRPASLRCLRHATPTCSSRSSTSPLTALKSRSVRSSRTYRPRRTARTRRSRDGPSSIAPTTAWSRTSCSHPTKFSWCKIAARHPTPSFVAKMAKNRRNGSERCVTLVRSEGGPKQKFGRAV